MTYVGGAEAELKFYRELLESSERTISELRDDMNRLRAAHRVALENDAERIQQLIADLVGVLSGLKAARMYIAKRTVPLVHEAWNKSIIDDIDAILAKHRGLLQ